MLCTAYLLNLEPYRRAAASIDSSYAPAFLGPPQPRNFEVGLVQLRL
jgi:hypothetical protein